MTYPTFTCYSTRLLACLTYKVPRCQALSVDWLCHYKMARYREQEYLGLMRSSIYLIYFCECAKHSGRSENMHFGQVRKPSREMKMLGYGGRLDT
jgi:hypothetical protein